MKFSINHNSCDLSTSRMLQTNDENINSVISAQAQEFFSPVFFRLVQSTGEGVKWKQLVTDLHSDSEVFGRSQRNFHFAS